MSEILSEDIQNRRQWIQGEVTRIERLLRRRIRGKLVWIGWYDGDDILSSVRRRLDLKVFRGELPVKNAAELDRLIFKMAHKVALEKYRKARRQRRLEQSVAQSAAQVMRGPWSDDNGQNLEQLVPALTEADKRLLNLWMDGLSQTEIAAELGLSLEAYRSRRKRLVARLRA